MRAMLFEHTICDWRHGLVNAENTATPMPDNHYWKLLGLVDIENSYLKEVVGYKNEMLEIDEEIFDKVPELNKLVND